jgi:hypothetical protein
MRSVTFKVSGTVLLRMRFTIKSLKNMRTIGTNSIRKNGQMNVLQCEIRGVTNARERASRACYSIKIVLLLAEFC